MALYPAAVKKLIAPGPTDPRITPRAAILHVDAGNADSLYGWFNGPSAGVESHFHVKKSGVVEQYRDTAYQADAQMGAARDSVSIETQGLAAGEWTAAQLGALVALLRWLATVHPIPLRLNTSESAPEGIAWHSQFRSWAGDGRTCPGVDRIPQIRSLIIPALTTASQEDDMPLTEDDARTLLTGSAVLKNPFASNPDTAPRVAASFILEQTAAKVAALAAPAAPSLTPADINAIATKVADLLAARLKS